MKKSRAWWAFCTVVLLAGCDGTYSGEGCFVGGTTVATPEGPLAIEQLKIGQMVFAYDVNNETRMVAPVDAVKATSAKTLFKFTLATGETFEVTGEHPLFDATKQQWRPARSWTKDEYLLRGGNEEKSEMIRIVSLSQHEISEPVPVYNLKVRDYQNAFIGGVLAHFY